MRRGFDPCSYPQVLLLPFMLLLFFMSALISYVGVFVLPSLPLFSYALGYNLHYGHLSFVTFILSVRFTSNITCRRKILVCDLPYIALILSFLALMFYPCFVLVSYTECAL